MTTPVVQEINQEAAAVNPTFAALDSPPEAVEVAKVDEVVSGVPEAKTEQIEKSDDNQARVVQVDENVQLRQMLRDQKLELELLKSTVSRHEAVQGAEVGTEIPLTDIEQLQLDIAEIGEARESEITTLLEVMELNPKYEDVKAVCTRDNFDDILAMAAVDVAAQHGISEVAATLLLEREVWAQTNPYKYMYDLVKSYHPKYADAATTKAVEQAGSGRAPKAVEAPVSVSGIAGGDSGIASGWTSSKIDALPETELSKVPVDIYEKYLQGTLA